MSFQDWLNWVITPGMLLIGLIALGLSFWRYKKRANQSITNVKPTYFGLIDYPEYKFGIYQGNQGKETVLIAKIVDTKDATEANATTITLSSDYIDGALSLDEMEYKATPDSHPDTMLAVYVTTFNLISAYSKQEGDTFSDRQRMFLNQLSKFLGEIIDMFQNKGILNPIN